ncbi:hypothetical protein Tco_0468341 [Tanacetum coccineum]
MRRGFSPGVDGKVKEMASFRFNLKKGLCNEGKVLLGAASEVQGWALEFSEERKEQMNYHGGRTMKAAINDLEAIIAIDDPLVTRRDLVHWESLIPFRGLALRDRNYFVIVHVESMVGRLVMRATFNEMNINRMDNEEVRIPGVHKSASKIEEMGSMIHGTAPVQENAIETSWVNINFLKDRIRSCTLFIIRIREGIPKSNKASWVSGTKVQTPNDKGGLGFQAVCPLIEISCSMVGVLSQKCSSGLNYTDEAGNGEEPRFLLLDNWYEGGVIKELFPRMFALELTKNATVSSKLNASSLDNSFRRNRSGIARCQLKLFG